MHQDTTAIYDSLAERPLPKWLTDQRDGLNTYQPEILVMKEDNSIKTSIILTGTVVITVIIFMTVLFLFKNKRKNKNESV